MRAITSCVKSTASAMFMSTARLANDIASAGVKHFSAWRKSSASFSAARIGDVEVDVDAHEDVVRRRLGARSGQPAALVQDELEGHRVRLLERAATDLAVALHLVRVAREELGAGTKDRQEEAGALAEVVGVHVAAVRTGRPRAGKSRGRHLGNRRYVVVRGRRRHDSLERLERDLDAGGEERLVAIDVDDLAARRPAPRHACLHLQDPHLERVTGLGAVDVDRPRQDVGPAGRLRPVRVVEVVVDVRRVGEDLIRRNAARRRLGDRVGLAARHLVQSLMRQRVDLDDGAARHRQERRRILRIEAAPHRLRRRRRNVRRLGFRGIRGAMTQHAETDESGYACPDGQRA